MCFIFLAFQVTYPTVRQQASWSLDDLPRTVAFTLPQGSSVTSMDFHPSHHTYLLGILLFKIFCPCILFLLCPRAYSAWTSSNRRVIAVKISSSS